MSKEKFLHYFKKKENTSEDNEDITITIVVTSVTKDITNAELSFATEEIKNHTVDLNSIKSKSFFFRYSRKQNYFRIKKK